MKTQLLCVVGVVSVGHYPILQITHAFFMAECRIFILVCPGIVFFVSGYCKQTFSVIIVPEVVTGLPFVCWTCRVFILCHCVSELKAELVLSFLFFTCSQCLNSKTSYNFALIYVGDATIMSGI